MKKRATRHDENLARLSRIEGQVRGIRRMVENGEYCVDIITQIQAVQAAIEATMLRILRKHLDHCVNDALAKGSRKEATKKVEEVLAVIKRVSKCG